MTLFMLSTNSDIFAQSLEIKKAKIHRNTSNDAKLEKNSKRDVVLRKRLLEEKQQVKGKNNKEQNFDFETLKKLKSNEIARKRNATSSDKARKSNRTFAAPYTEAYQQKASSNKFSEAEITKFEQKKQVLQEAKKIKLERKGFASASKTIIKTAYTKESLHKDIAELEQKVFCAEESGSMKASEIEKLKTAISNRETLLKTLD